MNSDFTIKSDLEKVSHILNRKGFIYVPLLQRRFVWDHSRCRSLVNSYKKMSNLNVYLLGTIIVTKKVDDDLNIIDGQQRLVATSLILCAIRDLLVERYTGSKEADIESMKNYINEFLINKGQSVTGKEEKTKIQLKTDDQPAYHEIIFGKEDCLKKRNNKIVDGYLQFRKELEELCMENTSRNLTDLFDAVTSKVKVIHITGSANEAHNLFQVFNQHGQPLFNTDLIRGYLFQKLGENPNKQEEYIKEYWNRLEKTFSDKSNQEDDVDKNLQKFFYHYIKAVKTDHSTSEETIIDPTKEQTKISYVVYDRYKEYLDKKFGVIDSQSVLEKVFHEINSYALAWLDINKTIPRNGSLDRKKPYLEILGKYDTVQPLLIFLFAQEVSDDVKFRHLTILSSYMLRRSICGLANRNDQVFPQLLKGIKANIKTGEGIEKSLENIPKSLAPTKDSDEFPSNQNFGKAFMDYSLYSSQHARPTLEAIEAFYQKDKKEKVAVPECQIEHIGAKTPKPDDKSQIDNDYVNTIGNLTLIGKDINQKMSNKTWEEKRDEFRTTKLYMNEKVSDCDTWDTNKVRERGKMLAELVMKSIFPHPYDDTQTITDTKDTPVSQPSFYEPRQPRYNENSEGDLIIVIKEDEVHIVIITRVAKKRGGKPEDKLIYVSMLDEYAAYDPDDRSTKFHFWVDNERNRNDGDSIWLGKFDDSKSFRNIIDIDEVDDYLEMPGRYWYENRANFEI